MIVLEYNRHLKEADHWKERLEKMTVGFQLLKTSRAVPLLTEGRNKVEGITAINQFLDQYEKDMAEWNQDRCDMWFFDE